MGPVAVAGPFLTRTEDTTMLTFLMLVLVVLLVAGMAWMVWSALNGCLIASVWCACGSLETCARFAGELIGAILSGFRD